MHRRTVGASVLALLLATVTFAAPVQAQETDSFGSLAKVDSGDFAPILDEALHIDYIQSDVDSTSTSDGIGIVRYDVGTEDPDDDIFAIDVDGDGELSADDVIIATDGFANSEVGTLVRSDDTFAGEGEPEPAHVVYADTDGSGRYDEGDYVFITSETAVGDDDLSDVELQSTTTASSSFTIRMTDTDSGDAGTIMKSGDDDFDEWRTTISLDADGDGTSTEFTFGYFAFFDSEGDDEFDRGREDLAYLLLIDETDGGGTDGAPDSGDSEGSHDAGPVPLYALRLWGEAGDFGSQVLETDSDFVPKIVFEDNISDIDIVHYDGGTDDDISDDVVALNLDGTNGLDSNDLILGAGPDAGGEAGQRITEASGLSGEGDSETDVYVTYADVDGNGYWNGADYLFLTTDSTSGQFASTTTSGSAFTIRLTDTNGGDAGTFVMSGDDDHGDWSGDVSRNLAWGSDAASFAFYDHDGDGSFDGGLDMAYIIPDDALLSTAVPHIHSVRLYGPLGDFGTPVGPEDPDGLPVLTDLGDVTAVDIVRYDAGTTSDVDDDVFAIDNDGDGELSAGDCVVATGGLGGSEVGAYITSTNTAILEEGTEEAAILAYADVDANTRFTLRGEGDWIYIVPDDSDDNIEPTTASEWSIRLTANDDGEGGTTVRTGDDDLRFFDDSALTDFGVGTPRFVYYDVDNDGDATEDHDLLYVEIREDSDDGDALALHSVRLCGAHSFTYDGPDITEEDDTDGEDGGDGNATDGDDGNATDGDDGNATDGGDGTDGSVDPSTPPGPGGEDIGGDGDDGNATDEDEDTPGPAVPLLVASMLGAAMAVHRRRNG